MTLRSGWGGKLNGRLVAARSGSAPGGLVGDDRRVRG